ncbi:hypothetical protein ACOME3_005213 [Neoechinorhynchus agilis]
MANTTKMEMKAKDNKKSETNESNVEKSIVTLDDISPIDTVVYRRRSEPHKSTSCQQLDYTVKRIAHKNADIFKTISWNYYLKAKYGFVEGSFGKKSSSKRKGSTVEDREMPPDMNEPIENVKDESICEGFCTQKSNGNTKKQQEITVTSSEKVEQKDLLKNISEKVLGKGNRTKSSAKNCKVASSNQYNSIGTIDEKSTNESSEPDATNRNFRIPSMEQNDSIQNTDEISPSKTIKQQKSPTIKRRKNTLNTGKSPVLTEQKESVKSIRQECRIEINKLQTLERKRSLQLDNLETSIEERKRIRSNEKIDEKVYDGIRQLKKSKKMMQSGGNELFLEHTKQNKKFRSLIKDTEAQGISCRAKAEPMSIEVSNEGMKKRRSMKDSKKQVSDSTFAVANEQVEVNNEIKETKDKSLSESYQPRTSPEKRKLKVECLEISSKKRNFKPSIQMIRQGFHNGLESSMKMQALNDSFELSREQMERRIQDDSQYESSLLRKRPAPVFKSGVSNSKVIKKDEQETRSQFAEFSNGWAVGIFYNDHVKPK